jgi:hypothetical protein
MGHWNQVPLWFCALEGYEEFSLFLGKVSLPTPNELIPRLLELSARHRIPDHPDQLALEDLLQRFQLRSQ